MATSLLRLGRLGSIKGVLREGWGTPRTSFIAALCTKTDVPPKTAKKAKASTDERASLLAYKPTVAFPSKLSATGFLSKDVALGESEITEAVSTAAASETTAGCLDADRAAEEAKITEVPPTNEVSTKSKGSKASDVEAKVQKDQDDSSSSSSSSSDSDSDSDSDDEKPKTEMPEIGKKAAEEKKAPGLKTEHVEKKAPALTTEHVEKKAPALTTEHVEKKAPGLTTEHVEKKAPGLTTEHVEKKAPALTTEHVEKKAPGLTTEHVEKKAPGLTTEHVEKKAPGLTTEHVEKKALPESASFGEAQEKAKTVTKAKPEEVPAPSVKPDGSDETLIDPAPMVSSSTTELIPEMSSEYIKADTTDTIVDNATDVKIAAVEEIVVEKEPEVKAEDAVKVAAEVVPEVPTEASLAEVVKTAVEASHGGVSEASGDVAAKPEDASSKAEAGTPAPPSEELVDPAPVAADAVEARAETTVVETPEEKAPEKAPEPEPEPEPEPFDNSTYKNLQHHQYNIYTFSDMDVELSKYRLPQPSAGRR
ncbi:nucleolar and coiled-body phosphoprotein 1 isoform X2 [Carassius gibelio]|uniref:nucleolar and coiled-body phosphoprotein 1 isoform X2 n=1 Tax=Carassius gibelio TaxID=101364 RepID=UPI002279B8FE|nr:nucleolar and coiled-body phosphoprotein 1 isoform X2 [Carassius gibelio]